MKAQQSFSPSAAQGVAEVIATTLNQVDSFSELSDNILCMNVEFTNSQFFDLLTPSQRSSYAYSVMQLVQMLSKLDKLAPELQKNEVAKLKVSA